MISFRKCIGIAGSALVWIAAMAGIGRATAQEPQQTSAVYNDWVVQCSLVATPPSPAAPAAAPSTAGAAKPGEKSPAPAVAAPSPAAAATPATPGRSCEMVQTFILRETGNPVAKLAVGKVPMRDETRAVLVAPLGVYLGEGAQIKIDPGKEIKGTFTRCDTSGCYAEFVLSKETVAELRAAKGVSLQFLSAQRAPLTFGVSLRGFAPAYDAVLAQSR